MIWKSHMKAFVCAATLATGLLAAAPSYALDLSGAYLANFSVASGPTKTVCFQLASTGATATYRDAGNVTSAKYPNYTGTYVVYKSGFHLAFAYAGHDSVTVTGAIAGGKLTHSSATEFTTTGAIDNVGTLSSTTSCASE
jgi:hypothetical protein